MLVASQWQAVDRQTLAFVAELNQTRSVLQSTNSANAQLLLEKLVAQWLAVSAYMRSRR